MLSAFSHSSHATEALPKPAVDLPAEKSGSPATAVFAGVRGFKPAFNRYNAWMHRFYTRCVAERRAPCPFCSAPTPVLVVPPRGSSELLRGIRGLYIACDACRDVLGIAPDVLAMHQPETERFWRTHGRIRLLRERDVVAETRPAVLIRFEEVGGRAALDLLFARDTLALIGAHLTDGNP